MSLPNQFQEVQGVLASGTRDLGYRSLPSSERRIVWTNLVATAALRCAARRVAKQRAICLVEPTRRCRVCGLPAAQPVAMQAF